MLVIGCCNSRVNQHSVFLEFGDCQQHLRSYDTLHLFAVHFVEENTTRYIRVVGVESLVDFISPRSASPKSPDFSLSRANHRDNPFLS